MVVLRAVRVGLLAVAAAAAVAAAPAHAGSGDAGASRYVVVLHDWVADAGAVAEEHRERFGADVELVYAVALKGYAGVLDRARVDDVRSDARVWFVEPDGVVTEHAQRLPTGVNRVEADRSGTAAIDGRDERVDVDVAILDSGIDVHHPDLHVVGGYNCARPEARVTAYDDLRGHGTHVAGTVAALDNDLGVVGVAPGARLWAVRVLDNTGSGQRSWIICGIDWVTAHADVIEVANMSLGGSGSDDSSCGRVSGDAEHLAICRAVAAGVTFVVAAGNDAQDAGSQVPAAYDEVITVSALADFDGLPGGHGAPTCGSSDRDDTFADFSNHGADVDLIAPGVCILSTATREGVWGSRSGYAWGIGTSMAAPHVTGAAALYLARHPDATPAEVRTALQQEGSHEWDGSDDPDGDNEPLLRVDRL